MPVLLALLGGAAAAQAQPADVASPPTARQVARACQADFTRRCGGGTMTGGSAERACLRQSWNSLGVGCRLALRRWRPANIATP